MKIWFDFEEQSSFCPPLDRSNETSVIPETSFINSQIDRDDWKFASLSEIFEISARRIKTN